MTVHSTIVHACSVVMLCVLCVAVCGCGLFSEDASAPPVTTQSTALAEFESYDEMARALGFEMVQIAGGGYEPQRYAVIDGRIGEIIYSRDESELNLRASDTDSDISGVNGVLYQRTSMNGTEVQIGNYRDILVAQFEINGRTYAMSATNMSQKSFESMVGQIVAQLSAA